MLQRIIAGLAFSVLSLVCISSRQASAADNELNFGFISTESSQHLRSVCEPFLADMEKKTGLKIKAFFASDYAGIIEGMRFNKVELAWYGNKAAMEAVDRAGGEVFASTTANDGTPGYYSHLVVYKDSPLNNVDDVLKNAKSLTFGNGDPNSTSGFLVPGYYVFAQRNLDPKLIFKRTLNANHETNVLSVANKQVDVATCNNETLLRLEKTNPEKLKDIKIVWTSPIIPNDPLVWRADLPEATKEKIRDFLFSYGVSGPNVEKERKILAELTWGPFLRTNNDHLLPIRQLELFKNRNKLENDQSLNAQDKTAQIAEIDAKLAAIQAKLKK